MLTAFVSVHPATLLAALPDFLSPAGPLEFVWFAVPAVLLILALWELMGLRYIPNNYVGIVEKLWSPSGSVSEGGIMAFQDEAGFQADVLTEKRFYQLAKVQEK